jgi:hypothetical protein
MVILGVDHVLLDMTPGGELPELAEVLRPESLTNA